LEEIAGVVVNNNRALRSIARSKKWPRSWQEPRKRQFTRTKYTWNTNISYNV